MHNDKRVQMSSLYNGAGGVAARLQALRYAHNNDRDLLAQQNSARVSSRASTLGEGIRDRRHILCDIFHVPRTVRSSHPLCRPRHLERFALPSVEAGAETARPSLVEEKSEERMQKTARFELHHADAHRGSNRFSDRGNTARGGHVAAHHIECF